MYYHAVDQRGYIQDVFEERLGFCPPKNKIHIKRGYFANSSSESGLYPIVFEVNGFTYEYDGWELYIKGNPEESFKKKKIYYHAPKESWD